MFSSRMNKYSQIDTLCIQTPSLPLMSSGQTFSKPFNSSNPKIPYKMGIKIK